MLEATRHPLGGGGSRVLARPEVGVGAEPVPLAIEGQFMRQALGQPFG